MKMKPEILKDLSVFNPLPAFEPSIDLRSIFEPKELATLAIEAVHRVKPGSSVFNCWGQAFSESMLLTVLTFCYASQIYASSEIEDAALENETVRYLCARVFPAAGDLRHFRRGNAAVIKRCLIELFILAEGKFQVFDDQFSTYATLSFGQMFSASRNWMFAAEVERRVTLAIQADSIALDA
jgi:hypothetical protein